MIGFEGNEKAGAEGDQNRKSAPDIADALSRGRVFPGGAGGTDLPSRWQAAAPTRRLREGSRLPGRHAPHCVQGVEQAN